MKKNHKRILILLLLFGAIFQVQAQKALVAVGGNATGGGGTASYTVGQIDYTSASGVNGKSNQGVQQPHEILIVGLDTYLGSDVELSVYPNPTLSQISLSVKNLNPKDLMYQLFDANGVLITNENLKSDITRISLENLQSATYVLRVLNKGTEVRAFKIIKK